MRTSFLLVSIVVGLGAGCGGAATVDCEALAEEQAECMTDAAVEDCKATNAQCEESGGEVLQLESCPLQFACSQQP